MFKTKNSQPQIAVFGYIVRGPIGGLAWHHLQYVLGLKRLGFEVRFFEDSDDYPGCYQPTTGEVNQSPHYGLKFIENCFKALELDNLWSYYDAHQNVWYGAAGALDYLSQTDILFNLSGVNPLRDWSLAIPKKIFLDTDPAFVQIKNLNDSSARQLAEAHTDFFCFGENIGAPDSKIPLDGFKWKPTRQPIVNDVWRVCPGNPENLWTTVMQWDSYRAVSYQGKRYGMKSVSFEQIIDLPQLTNERFELALGSPTAPRENLTSKGWRVINPLIPTKTINSYQNYISQSKAEFSVAKEGYVISLSGWFSERSAAYLASGRPVVTEETGFSRHIETGRGLFAYTNQSEALEAINRVCRDYEFHCQAARQTALEYFDYRSVLLSLLKRSLG